MREVLVRVARLGKVRGKVMYYSGVARAWAAFD